MGADHGPETVCKAQERYCVDRQSFSEVAAALGIAASTVRRWAEQRGWDSEREAIASAEAEIRASTVKARALALRRLLEAKDGGEASRAASVVAALERIALDQELRGREFRDRALREQSASGLTDPGRAKGAEAAQPGGAAKRRASRSRAAKEENLSMAAAPIEPGGPIGPGASAAPEDALPAAGELGEEERVRLLEEAVNRQLAFVLTRPVDDLSKRIKEIKAALDVLASIKGREAGGGGIVVTFAEQEA